MYHYLLAISVAHLIRYYIVQVSIASSAAYYLDLLLLNVRCISVEWWSSEREKSTQPGPAFAHFLLVCFFCLRRQSIKSHYCTQHR